MTNSNVFKPLVNLSIHVNKISTKVENTNLQSSGSLEQRIIKLEVLINNHLEFINKELKELKDTLSKLVEISEAQVRMERDLHSANDKITQLDRQLQGLETLQKDMVELNMRVNLLEEKERSLSRRAWDMVKMSAAAVIGAVTSHFMTR